MSMYSAFRPPSPSGAANLWQPSRGDDNGDGMTSTKASNDLAELDPSLERERAQDASLLLLPLLLANPPSIPSHLKSSEVRHRHQILSLSPHDVDRYLVTAPPTAEQGILEKVISGLEQLKASVEQYAGILATDTDAMEHILGGATWKCPEHGVLLARLLLGEGRGSSSHGALALILKREDEGRRSREPWKFHNLLPADTPMGAWHKDLDRAMKATQLGVSGDNRDGRSASVTSNATTGTTGSYNTAEEQARPHESNDQERPPDLYTSADDFWGGWDDEDGDKTTKGQDDGPHPAADDGNSSDDDDYWNSYDVADPKRDAELREAQETERRTRLDLDTVSQMDSVNFDRMEHRVDIHPSEYRTMTHVSEEETRKHFLPMHEGQDETRDASEESASRTYESFPVGPNVTLDSLTAQRGGGAGSPRSDATSFGGTEHGDERAGKDSKPHHAGKSASTRDEVSDVPDGGSDGNVNDRPQPSRYHSTESNDFSSDMMDGDGSEMPDDDDDKDVRQALLRKTKSGTLSIGDVAAEQQRQLGKRYPPPPQSVSGQSTYETPQNMNLAELESLFRNRDQQRMIELRERLSRMHEDRKDDHQARDAAEDISEDEQGENQDQQADAAIGEADDILREAERDVNGLPGLELVEPNKHTGKKSKDRQRHGNSQTSTSQSQQSDPVEALSQADPNIGLSSQRDDDQTTRPALPFGNRAVSMDTLRKLTEQQQQQPRQEQDKKGPGSVRFGPGDPSLKSDGEQQTTTSGGQSKAGGFKNFLQLAPSTIVTDLDAMDEDEDEVIESEGGGEDDEDRRTSSTQLEEEAQEESAVDDEQRSDQEENGSDQGEDENGPDQVHRIRSTDDAAAMFEEQEEASQIPIPMGAEPLHRSGAAEHGASDEIHDLGDNAQEADPSEAELEGSHVASGSGESDEEGPADEQARDKALQGEDDFDFDAFMYPKRHESKVKAATVNAGLDSPSLTNDDILVQEALSAIKGSQKGDDFREERNGRKGTEGLGREPQTPARSESQVPGAASDASVRPLLGSIVHRLRSNDSAESGATQSASGVAAVAGRGVAVMKFNDTVDEAEEDEEGSELDRELAKFRSKAAARRNGTEASSTRPKNQNGPLGNADTRPQPKPKQAPKNASGDTKGVDAVGSTNTELGLADIDEREAESEKHSVAPGPNWVGAAPPPGSTSQRTANLRHQYLKEQRKQALETQRSRIQAQRGHQPSSPSPQRQSSARPLPRHGDPSGESKGEDVPAPLLRAASQRPPFPRERTADRGSTMSDPTTQQARKAGSMAINNKDGEEQFASDREENGDHEEDAEANGIESNVESVEAVHGDEDQGQGEVDHGDDEEAPAVSFPEDMPIEEPLAVFGDEVEEQHGPYVESVDADGEEEQDGEEEMTMEQIPQSPSSPVSPAPPPPAPRANGRPGQQRNDSNNNNSNGFAIRQQEARYHASRAAARRRELLRAAERRKAHVKTLLRSVVNLLNDDAEDILSGGATRTSMSEPDFLRLCREAWRESEREREERIANGAGGFGGGGARASGRH